MREGRRPSRGQERGSGARSQTSGGLWSSRGTTSSSVPRSPALSTSRATTLRPAPTFTAFTATPRACTPTTARRFIETLVGAARCRARSVLRQRHGSRRGTSRRAARPRNRCESAGRRADVAEDARHHLRGAEPAARESPLRGPVGRRQAKQKAGATHRYGSEDVALFEPHVLLELDGLRAALRRVDADWARRALALDARRSSSGESPAGRYVARARRTAARDRLHPTSCFNEGRGTGAASRRVSVPRGGSASHGARSASHPNGSPSVRLGDARRLEGVARGSIDLVVTSPPYPGARTITSSTTRRARVARARRLPDSPGIRLGLAATSSGFRTAPPSPASRPSSARVSRRCRARLAPPGRIVLILADSVIRKSRCRATG